MLVRRILVFISLSFAINLFNVFGLATAVIIFYRLEFIPFYSFEINTYLLYPISHAQFMNSSKYVLNSLFLCIIFLNSI